MICAHCQQREASITITKVQHGEKLEQHYCEECAPQFHPFSFTEKEEPISLQQLLSGWFSIPQQKNSQIEPNKKTSSCPTCNLTYRQFLKQGKFGCADCYGAFSEYLPKILQRIQAGIQHVDPNEKVEQDWRVQLRDLRDQLQQLIEEERFEEAITCRDKIRELEHKLNGGVSS
ncbi:MAG: UvrB/UvrC motif-containing protein [Solibacillus sp.]